MPSWLDHLRKELATAQSGVEQAQQQLAEERKYVESLRAHNGAQSEANAQLQTSLEQAIQQREGALVENTQLKTKLTTTTQQLEDSRNQVEMFSAGQAAVKDNLAQTLKEREDLLLQVQSLKSAINASQEETDMLAKDKDRLQTKLQVSSNEIDELSKKIAGMSVLQIELAELQDDAARTKKALADQRKAGQALETERNQLRDLLRQQEVEQQTGRQAGAAPASTSKLTQSSNKKDLYQAMRAAESESKRLQDYVDKLLMSVIEKAPFVLEAIK